MRKFELVNAQSFEEAAGLHGNAPAGKADFLAGGTDLLNSYKHAVLAEHPDQVINLKNIPDSAGIEAADGEITVKAMTKLTAIEESDVVPAALSQAAKSVATPLIRNLATIGGNICQDVRCWYYRYPHEAGGRMDCARKGGETCYAIQGENRYHSIFGGMRTGANACTHNCPAGTDISAYMDEIRKGDWDAAAEIIMRVNPMPMCTARICPHPCQDSCNQNKYGDCVSIHCVERTLGDYILANADKFYKAPETESGKKAAIIGAGPAGLTAAYFLRKAGHSVVVYDSHEKAGGVLQYGIPHYRLPKSIVDSFVAALAGMGIEFVLNTTVGKEIEMDAILAANDTVFVGTGAWEQPILGLKGEELTSFGLNFLVEVNTFLKNAIDDDVLVCGGGNVAMDVALTAKRMGAKNVRLVCLEEKKDMPASAEEVARAEEEGIEIINGWGLKSVITDAEGNVCGLESMKCLSVFDENGRFAPAYDHDNVQNIEAKTIILATGQRVDLNFLGNKLGAQVKTERGLMDINDETYQTKNEKIYAGGDAVTGPSIAIRAIRAGRAAAYNMSIQMDVQPEAAHKKAEGFITYDVNGVAVKEGAKQVELPVEKRTLTDEDSLSLSMEQATEEAKRCMNCGCYSVNASDISPVLAALDGTVVTNKKEVAAADFFTTKLKAYDMLDQDELVTAVKVPALEGYVSGYDKSRIRSSIDFAIIGLAWAYKLENGVIADVKIAAGAVAPVPVRLTEVEQLLIGKAPSVELAKEAGALAVKDAVPMDKNTYKVNGLTAIVERMVEGMR